jgi:zinc protease
MDLDRRRRPAPLPNPEFHLPQLQKTVLSNGLNVWLMERHSVPQIALSVVLPGGAWFDPPAKEGLAMLTADLFESGTTTRTIVQIAERLEYLGSGMNVHASSDATIASIVTLTRCAEESIELFSDVLIRPVFPETEFHRVQERHLTTIRQRKDRPGTVATLAFLRRLYGDHHPYAYDGSGTEASLGAIFREDVLRHYSNQMLPSLATLIVAGDTTMGHIVPVLEHYFTSWMLPPRDPLPLPPDVSPEKRRIYLIDKPGAPQSEIRMGYPALARSTPDYFAVSLMNRILGGQFSSRINLNLREKRGYTYGARSSFLFLKRPGPFMISGAFVTPSTDSAIEQLFIEVEAMHREGVTEEELEFARKGLAGSFPLNFETPGQIAGALQSMALYDLPEDYYDTYLHNVHQVSLAQVRSAASRHLRSEFMNVVVVGDVQEIKGRIENLGMGDVVLLTADGDILD